MERCPMCGGSVTPRFIRITPELRYADGTRHGAIAEDEMYHEMLECQNSTGGVYPEYNPTRCGWSDIRSIPTDEIRRNRRTKGK